MSGVWVPAVSVVGAAAFTVVAVLAYFRHESTVQRRIAAQLEERYGLRALAPELLPTKAGTSADAVPFWSGIQVTFYTVVVAESSRHVTLAQLH